MKRRTEYQFIVVLIFASIALALVSMASLSEVRLGLDFGKDTRVIVQVEDDLTFNEFVKELQFDHAQTRLRVTDGGVFILDVSGVESGEEFVKDIETRMPEAKVLLSGTFGSMTKFLNNQSFVAMCISVFVVLLGVYYISRFHLAGWYYWLLTSLILMASLLIVMASGVVFTQTLWYAFLLSFCSLFYINSILETYEENGRLIFGVCLSFMAVGLVLMSSVLDIYLASSLYLFIFGIVSFVFYLVHGKLINPLLQSYLEGRVFPLSDLFEVDDNDSLVFSRTVFSLVILVFLTGLLSLSRNQTPLSTATTTRENVVVFNKADSATYLEVQARLSKLEMLEKQISYRVSEQGQTWLEFDDTMEVESLESISKDLSLGLNLDVLYYQTLAQSYTTIWWLYPVLALMILGICILVLSMKKSFVFSSGYTLISILSYGGFILLSTFFNLLSDYSWSFLAVLLPLVIVLVLLRYVVNEKLSYRRFFVESLISSVTVLVLMISPVLIIYPGARNAEMMLTFLLVFLSIHAVLGVVSWILVKRGRVNHVE